MANLYAPIMGNTGDLANSNSCQTPLACLLIRVSSYWGFDRLITIIFSLPNYHYCHSQIPQEWGKV